MEGGREGEEGRRVGGREGWREGGREGWREGGREGGRDGGEGRGGRETGKRGICTQISKIYNSMYLRFVCALKD